MSDVEWILQVGRRVPKRIFLSFPDKFISLSRRTKGGTGVLTKPEEEILSVAYKCCELYLFKFRRYNQTGKSSQPL
jgi:hypothetical protein